MKLAIDAMGSDLGSSIVEEPARKYLALHKEDELYVYGNEEELASLKGIERLHVVPTTQVIAMDDGALAVMRKKDSSMYRAVKDIKDGVTDGMVSCGSTGALFSAGSMLLKNIKGISRAGLLILGPSATGRPFAFIDIGVNADVEPEDLDGFALLGSAYMQADQRIKEPKVSLLNVGAEAHKGDEVHRKAYELMSADKRFNFAGNIEANHILNGDTDVIVSDGFSGNIAEKAIEGTAMFLLKQIKGKLMSSFITKIGALLIKNSLKDIKSLLDPNRFGGAWIAGLNAPIVKAHGNSNSEALFNALEQLRRIVQSDLVNKVREQLSCD